MTSFQASAVASSSEEGSDEEPHRVAHSIGIIQTTANPALLPAALFERDATLGGTATGMAPGLHRRSTFASDAAIEDDAVRVITTYCPLQTPTREYHTDTLDCIAQAAQTLIDRGAVVIVLDTGYSALQTDLSNRFAGKVPIVATSLLQLASLRNVMPRCGVITLDRQGISSMNLAAVLADPATPVLGMDPAGTWRQLLDPEQDDIREEAEEMSKAEGGPVTASIPIASRQRHSAAPTSLTMSRMSGPSPSMELLPSSYSSTFASVRAFDARETPTFARRESGVLHKLRLERLIERNDQVLLDELLTACKALHARYGSTCIILEEPRFATFTRRLQDVLAVDLPGIVLFDVVATVQWLYAGYRSAHPRIRSDTHNANRMTNGLASGPGTTQGGIVSGVGLPLDGNYIGGSSNFAAASPLSRRAMHASAQDAGSPLMGPPSIRPIVTRTRSMREQVLDRIDDASIIGDTMPLPLPDV
jgi:hypothetical protein